MLCGLTSMSIGECRMQDLQLSDSIREWQSRLGYCPQEDALMDAFTGNEILEFFARLRGVPGDMVRDLVGSVASVLDIFDTGVELCETYSTEECKLACQRVSIMAGGEVKALGTMDELRDKFARGFTISFRLFEKPTAFVVTAVDKGVKHLFPGVRQAECREGTFLYYIDYRLPWSHVFSRVKKLRWWFKLESVLVSESSLDEILLGLARAEQAEDAAEAKQAAKDASRYHNVGDPWGRDAQDQLERRQRVREKRRRRNSPTHADMSEGSHSDGGIL
ncbi:hypothetical protein HPB52_024497 [Rhipicephalus sanguineus]|uniref:Uncharacterized protein n=1 Tax=Rhipicephalus sanguineus TaxID=34632 RepID=A0A9D4YR32_RHISA|nr:hypothetical protein HPB52_024497 [Rhipicephalus sanguineus]